MTGEIGHLLLMLAAVAAAVQMLAGLQPRPQPRLAATALGWQFAGLFGALAALGLAFHDNDFSLAYVAAHGHTTMPRLYAVSAVWGGHEGSMLLWCAILALWSVLAGWRLGASGDAAARTHAVRTLGVLGAVSLAMCGYVLLTSDPFVRLLPGAPEGRGLNPMLQDPGLALHPPLLYLGYVGTALPFAATLAALAWGEPAGLARRLRPFTAAALAFLSLGIALGSWWAYYELGWGGWWFWDPVENASLMPWLVLAALLHLQTAQDLHGRFAPAAAWLSIAGFVLALIGIFLVRSGVLTSVHAFASDPRRGSTMLGLIALTLAVSLTLGFQGMHRLGGAQAGGRTGEGARSPLSREGALAAGALLLLVACASVLLGTLYPLAVDALGLGKLSVGAPYFDAVMAPLLLPALLLMIPAARLRWGRDEGAALWRRLRPVVLVTGPAAIALPLLLDAGFGRVNWGTALTLWLATGVLVATLQALHARCGGRWRRLDASGAGMGLAHLGVALFACGVAMVKTYGIERDVHLAPGQTHAIAGCALHFDATGTATGPNYRALTARFTLQCPSRAPVVLTAEKRAYDGSAMPMTESAIDWGLTRDVYVALGEQIGSGAQAGWGLRVQHRPFIRWIWIGVALMGAGALLAGASRRLHRHRAPARRALPAHALEERTA
ncbi:heme lyase CcmF/NrfE family subunit [Sphaerotilus uruguayifluvii]|uniref:Cytochrome c-type biogenesis protein CcmF n=1 Tax=Sphaerotilus uruguayifluvii TaxID=2735897 RepID=A0ABX2FY93_9BURK|nr:heme lyase CcmF/NrfE family subunit [Leptothrix sp. C29]NRT54990.1 cytochrome c-type biogenesis protein CcmF [Leptothrix sp. C29]